MDQQEMTLFTSDQELVAMAREIARGETALANLRRSKQAAVCKFQESIKATERQLSQLRARFADVCLQADLPGMEVAPAVQPVQWATVTLSVPAGRE